MKENRFYAMLSRMKYIRRWGLMRSSREENLSEHSLETAVITHALCAIASRRLGQPVDTARAVMHALYHDCSEILTGDLPTPVKYFNPEIEEAYHRVEAVASTRLLEMLPADLREEYAAAFAAPEGRAGRICKAADRISALIKCIEEAKAGNDEFLEARKSIEESIHAMELEEAEIFLKEFLPAYSSTLDELSRGR